MKKRFKESVTIGVLSFLGPFLGVMAYAYCVLGWPLAQAQIAGIALSTTPVAVIYSVMIETGYNEKELGKIIIAATFITDLGVVPHLQGVCKEALDEAASCLDRDRIMRRCASHQIGMAVRSGCVASET